MKKIFVLIFVISSFVSCSSDSVSSDNQQFYESFVDNNITPLLNQLEIDCENQRDAILAFKENPTQSNFNVIQEKWLSTALTFSKTTLYNYPKVASKYFNINIYNYIISPSKIESEITINTTFTSSYFNNKTQTIKGLGSIEYLLYNNNNEQEALNLLTQENNASKRIDYLLALSEYTLAQATSLKNFWLNEYKQDFITANSKACSDNRKCIAINQIINVLDVARVTKIGKPAGIDGVHTNVELLEAYKSKSSLLLIKASLEEAKKIYLAGTQSFHTLVDEIDDSKKITASINGNFSTTFKAIDDFNNTLYDGIVSNSDGIHPIYNGIKSLVTSFSVDVTSILSIATLPTDNDGD
ncbi:hypothetical protein AXE80_08630 [Wenyingzhuangia fucanilytica]|uniref:Imelysin-like domain-containing protein n=1 Tax=Wenyingzhuangia fucanilytica TaxID=1790137 RepID=A0A1B1Y6H1_9FLAO|nr:imelysin family protein [Wenyingzhuangia fucanilytica]ANW96338.1 hypothetical protein AXE80_08630 [Wenyingzhuangia fucanilytica]